MLINWFTVFAQAINFLILVWLLKRFLYGPIMDAIDTREQYIAKTLADAADKQRQAEQEKAQFIQNKETFSEQRKTLLQKAITAANKERQRLLEDAKSAADALTLQHQKSLLQQLHELSIEINQKMQMELFALTRQMLSDLADSDLDAQIINVFLAQLHKLNTANKKSFISALSTNDKPLQVRSAFTLQSEQKKQISNAIEHCFACKLKINFETADDIISGIELTVNGQKLSWNMAYYLDSLEKHLQQLLQKNQTIAKEPETAASAPQMNLADE